MALSKEALEYYNQLCNQQKEGTVTKDVPSQQKNEEIETCEVYDDEFAEEENLNQVLSYETSSEELKELKEELNYAVGKHAKTYRNMGIVAAVNTFFTASCYACTIPFDTASGSQLSTTLGMMTLGSVVVSGYCFYKQSKYNGKVINVKNSKKSDSFQKVKKIHI